MSKINIFSKTKVFVAMSGGVDSSVAAALLKKANYQVTGVYFKPWSDMTDLSYCNWKADRQDAMRVAVKLGIPFETWDFSKEYEKEVTLYMIDSYRNGITPNPDIVCNKEIKFGIFLQKALTRGADYIATGHYIKKKTTVDKKTKLEQHALFVAKDKNKDQSYFLYSLTQKELAYSLFPLGNHTKPQVRLMAKKFGLLTHNKKDSQGVCFVGKLDMKDFLQKYIQPKNGEIKIYETNETIGQHDGVYYYTIGQRHGLDLGVAGGPFFVVKKDIKKNIIYVSCKTITDTTNKKILVTQPSWVVKEPTLPSSVQAKIRYRTESITATIEKTHNGLVLQTKTPIKSPASGQSAVFYHKNEMLGGGIIA